LSSSSFVVVVVDVDVDVDVVKWNEILFGFVLFD
jgi:hypothetical protein